MTKPNGVHAVTTTPPPGTPVCQPCGVLMVRTEGTNTGWRCINCGAQRPDMRAYITPDEFKQAMAEDARRRDLARALGMSPDEPWPVLLGRAAQIKTEHGKLTDAAAAFRACLEGRPEYIAVRPVCRTPQCDNLVRKNGLCGRCYEQKEGRP